MEVFYYRYYNFLGTEHFGTNAIVGNLWNLNLYKIYIYSKHMSFLCMDRVKTKILLKSNYIYTIH